MATARPVTRSSHALSLSVLSHPSREARRTVFDFQGSRITPPAPPFARGKGIAPCKGGKGIGPCKGGKGIGPCKGGKGIARSRRHFIARNKNTRLEIVPPTQSTPTFHRSSVGRPVGFWGRSSLPYPPSFQRSGLLRLRSSVSMFPLPRPRAGFPPEPRCG